MKMTDFHRHYTVVVEEVGSHHGDRGIQRAGCEEVAGAHVAPFPDLSGRSHCPVGPGCVPSAARPSSSSPWLLAGSCHHSHLARPWLRRQAGDSSPGPSDRHGFGCVYLGGHRSPLPLLSDDQGSSHDVCGRHSCGLGRCGHYCSTHHPS